MINLNYKGELDMQVNFIICGVIAIPCIIFIYQIFKKTTEESIMPNMASTIGVLGTFIGIAFALRGFNPNSILVLLNY